VERVRSPLATVSSRWERRALPLGSASSFWPGSGSMASSSSKAMWPVRLSSDVNVISLRRSVPV
jgi:hypothetical protein